PGPHRRPAEGAEATLRPHGLRRQQEYWRGPGRGLQRALHRPLLRHARRVIDRDSPLQLVTSLRMASRCCERQGPFNRVGVTTCVRGLLARKSLDRGLEFAADGGQGRPRRGPTWCERSSSSSSAWSIAEVRGREY